MDRHTFVKRKKVSDIIWFCFFVSVLSGIKQVNVELEPGFQAAQKRNSAGGEIFYIECLFYTWTSESYVYCCGDFVFENHAFLFR